MRPAEYAKAIAGAAVAALAALGTALSDGDLTAVEWVGVASAAIVAGAAVFGVPNADPDPESVAGGRHRADDAASDPDPGPGLVGG